MSTHMRTGTSPSGELQLRQVLERVAQRFRQVRLWSGLALCWLAWSLAGLAVLAVVSRAGIDLAIPGGWPALVIAVGASGVVCAVLALRSARDPRWVARRIEARHPDLGTGLLAAVEQTKVPAPAPAPVPAGGWGTVPVSGSGRLGYLQTAVIQQALEHDRSHDWKETVPTGLLRGAKLAHAAALGGLLLVAAVLFARAQSRDRDEAGAAAAAGGAVAAGVDVKVEPGNAEIERGTPLLVVARFGDPRTVPVEASLVVENASQGAISRPMTRSLEDPTFAGRVEAVDADLTYRVAFDGRSTETFRVTVFEYPELERTDARLVFPNYTALDPTTVEDIRHVTAVEGTELTLLCRLNKEVATARLVDEKAPQTLVLTPDPEQAGPDRHVYRTTWTLTDSRRFKVELVDHQGRHNKPAADLVVNVTRNRPAVVKMTQPARDVRVSPVEELRLRAELEDDYGVVRHGVSYSLGGEEPHDLVLKGAEKPGKRVRSEQMLDFEGLKAAPDQLVTYFFWAEDVGPDGQPRRTQGDMFFAEVRHFEEIFRQGEQPPSGSESEGEQQGNAQDANRLAELQKEIINGTWKLIRRETGVKPSAKFGEDGKLLQEAQQSAIEQAGPLAERLRDAASKASLEQATKLMKDALKELGAAVQKTAVAPLRPALVAEQAAYQALLKLRAREFEVTRGQRQRGGRGGRSGGSPSDRQLQQLELTSEENRYEEQRSARARQEQQSQREREQGENRQILSRLRELAQRQTDLNDRLKELQSALEAAKDQEARAEIERQLKRLREQEQQILRDTDELRERMEREENRDRMAEAREQIDQGREHVRQAAEALEEGRLSQAVTEGARAGRQLNDLREEVRKRSANRFSEEMTEMREQARRLDDTQDKLSEQLDAWNRRPQRSLRDNPDRTQTRQELDQQRKQLDQLLERMRTTVQDAEDTEPLLAKNLFDTVQQANQQAIPETLRAAEQLVDLGVVEEAARASRRAGQGLDQLRQGVERAARSVLGDETAALKRAQGELEDLADQVNREIARATGRQPNDPNANPDPNNRSRPGQRGQRGQAQDPQEKGQPGQGQDGQQPQGEGQEPQDGQQGQQGQQVQQKGQQGQQKGQRGQQKGQQGQQKGQQGQQGGGGQGQGNQEGQPGEPQGGQGNEQGQPKGQQGPRSLRRGNGQTQPQDGRQAGGPAGGGGALDRMLDGIARGPGGPITGEGYRQWSDRMREVEELLENPDLRAEAARIRDRARGAREEFKRHSKEPNWDLMKELVAQPLQELRQRVAEEVRRRESPDALVPIDRDPVPPQFTEGVRRYYERLGSGQ
jgi:hypothetical protein